jgi:hypothetical protein
MQGGSLQDLVSAQRHRQQGKKQQGKKLFDSETGEPIDGGQAGGSALTLDVVETLSIVLQVCRGLVYLHTRRPPLIHRDIKSDNILCGAVAVDDVGVALGGAIVAKIGDFGTARADNRVGQNETHACTQMVVGTTPYSEWMFCWFALRVLCCVPWAAVLLCSCGTRCLLRYASLTAIPLLCACFFLFYFRRLLDPWQCHPSTCEKVMCPKKLMGLHSAWS